MIKLGEKQILKVVKKVEFGVYLADEEDKEERVLLPVKQVSEGIDVGDAVEVFVYRDSKDRIISTVKEPLLKMGEVARLKVVDVNKFGAFLDWGLEKDLFLPFRQQTERVNPTDTPLVSLYIDKSGRLCATMNVYPDLSKESPYKKDDRVTGCVYQISREFGAFVAVDDQYSGLIPQKEFFGDIKIGDTVNARVTSVKEDGKLDLSIREKAYLQIEEDALRVMQVIDSFDGVLPFTDKASPEVIKREMHMSKNEFKRAVGHLLKNHKINITEKAIHRVNG
ncbi:MAG TPA: S1-like domain-containing RNA-binding protein [Lachnospiraceae bacterium]|nr:S1-like domain-containing RNA-binding protein [Lachnospiraceae bacterium]